MFKKYKKIIPLFLVLIMIIGTFQTSFAINVNSEYGSQREYVVSLIKSAGMDDELIGVEEDQDALAKSLGFLDNWEYNPTSMVTEEVKASMDTAMTVAYNGLREALSKKPLEPYFVNGMAQPIFYYGNSKYYDTSGEGVARFVVYVESELDSDGDGELDLVKALVQLPRAGLEGAKLSTIYEARPYIEGCGSQRVPVDTQTAGDNYLKNNPEYSHEDLYSTAQPRVVVDETSSSAMVEDADHDDWYYRYVYNGAGFGSATAEPGNGSNETEYEDLNWYDYFLVRGFAVVESGGLGTVGSDGFATCGSDVEITAFKNVIEWITGDRKAYSDKNGNIEIKADWSNGNIGMTGRSYAGTTQFGLATTGVKGLKTIVPVAGIASWYEYTNSQGIPNSIPYTTGLAWYVNSRIASPDWNSVFDRYAGYSQLMRNEETALKGDYGPHWARRDYTVENWFRDWGPSKIKTPMLIVHGANDDNVRPKQSMMMYEASKKANVDVRWIWHQGHHMTPTYPRADPNAMDSERPYSMYCGDYTYDELLNLWFSHYLYDEDNKVLDIMPGVLAQDNHSAEWISYDSMDSTETIVLNDENRVLKPKTRVFSRNMYEEPEDYSEEFPLLDHTEVKYSGDKTPMELNLFKYEEPQNVVMPETFSKSLLKTISVIDSTQGSRSWQNLLDLPTAGSSLYAYDLPEDVTIKGVVPVNFRASIISLASNASEPLRVHAKLVEIASPGTTLKFYGGNAVGSGIPVDRIKTGGSWQGGGVPSQNLVEFRQADTGTYREIAKGWMDLCNPLAGFQSYTADRENSIVAQDNIGTFHDYTIFLQPAIHTAKEGNKLALIITTGGARSEAYTGDNAFTFVIDNEKTKVVIPVEYDRIEDDTAALEAAEVDRLISRFAAKEEVSEAYISKVEAARTAYNALSEEAKALVKDSNLRKLIAAEAKIKDYQDRMPAEAVDRLISRFRAAETNISEEYIARVKAARTAYDALSSDSKALVKEANVRKLIAAEAKIQAETDKKAAAAVDRLISRFRAAETDISEDYIAKVNAARTAYDALSAEAKNLVVASNLTKLIRAEAKIQAKVEAEAAAKAEAETKAQAEAEAKAQAEAEAAAKAEAEAAAKAEEEAEAKAKEEAAEKLEADTKDAAAVDRLISRFRAAETDISEDYIAKVNAARTAYDALSEEAKSLVGASNLTKLTRAETKIQAEAYSFVE